MKVIVASCSKTGTKSLCTALRLLDYNVHDIMETIWYNADNWLRILNEGGTIDDLRRMYENVDAVTDIPAYYFWEELHIAFPDAKIILTTRDEDSWYKSYYNQLELMRKNWMVALVMLLSPLGRKHFKLIQSFGVIRYGVYVKSPLQLNHHFYEMQVRRHFRQHQDYCLKVSISTNICHFIDINRKNAPKDKLLVYNIKDGWEPLCKFLGKDIPNKPFPHRNVKGELVKKLIQSDRVFQRMKREMMTSLAVIFCVSTFAIYKTIKHGYPWTLYTYFFS